MAVYVDEIISCLPNRKWRWSVVCHMVSPDTDELHAFAARLGLRRSWFQGAGAMPHYDLTPGMRARAVAFGAIEVGRENWLEIFRPIRAAWVARKNTRTACETTPGKD
jgi:hypothetical protein